MIVDLECIKGKGDLLFTKMAHIYQNGSYLPKWPIFTKMAAVNVCLIFCYFFQMLQFDFTCVQPASSARMSIHNGATTEGWKN